MPKRKSRPPSAFFAEQVRIVRERKHWNQQQLADRLAVLGVDMDQRTISKIENGKRGIYLDDALAICAALGPAPVHLFVPTYLDEVEDVALAPKLIRSARAVRQWVRGQSAIEGDDDRFFAEQVSEDERRARERTGVSLLLKSVQSLVDAAADGDEDAVESAVDTINRWLQGWNALEGRGGDRGAR